MYTYQWLKYVNMNRPSIYVCALEQLFFLHELTYWFSVYLESADEPKLMQTQSQFCLMQWFEIKNGWMLGLETFNTQVHWFNLPKEI